MTKIRAELPNDYDAVRDVHVSAFSGDIEARLVDLLRQRRKAVISLVSEVDSQVVGHIMFSAVTLDELPTEARWIGLAPVGVLPNFQNRRIGSALILEGLAECNRRGYEAVVLLGDPRYYSRFGFGRAADFGLTCEYNAPDAFQVLELKPAALRNARGLVRYAPEFSEVSA
jgi:putative acetyltransferase